jgi:hypothetical protein
MDTKLLHPAYYFEERIIAIVRTEVVCRHVFRNQVYDPDVFIAADEALHACPIGKQV